ncbi:hypothetical protein Sjap_015840 [Stephania japonica]|uniref:Uncharacterized protein n=1 Tax=Stephania japonica TaxID=461633 RepID=A0AAP0IK10_9MAGN
MVVGEKTKGSSNPAWLLRYLRCLPFSFSSSKSVNPSVSKKDQEKSQRKPGGWKAMPYILGNETFERLATVGLLANFMVYLTTFFHLDQVYATNIINIWSGTTGFAPLVGAFISDAWWGRFKTLAFASIVSFVGMISLTLTAVIPSLHPPHCTKQELLKGQCVGPTTAQLAFLFMSLGWMSIAAGGIRPCSIPFGVDQFDATTEKGRRDINSFFNWYYATFTVVILVAITLLVYIQDSVSWGIGLGIPTGLMFCSIILFFLGTRIYIHVPPEGSVFNAIAQVFIAAYKKRHVEVLHQSDSGAAELIEGGLYDPPLKETTMFSKLPHTPHFSALDKAAVVLDGEVDVDGERKNKWRLCSVQQVEEVKCLLRVAPIWASGIICFVTMSQQGTFTISQAQKMDRHLGPKFQIPAGSLGIISMTTIGIWIPLYDRVIVPRLRKLTKHEEGITLLQRMGIGIVFSILSMVVAGIVENRRRASANLHASADGVAPMHVMWLAPQLIFMGLAEGFNFLGQIEFYYKQFPEHMKSVANALPSCSMAGASYLSSVIVSIVHKSSGGHGRPDWLSNNINAGRVDYFYYLIAGLGILNFIYFFVCSSRYHYKGAPIVDNDDTSTKADVELKGIKHADI